MRSIPERLIEGGTAVNVHLRLIWQRLVFDFSHQIVFLSITQGLMPP